MNIEHFTGRAKAYAEARPSYPKKAIDYIINLAPKHPTFADIGAGTGKLTEQLASCEYPIFAIEPNEDMRQQLKKTLKSFKNAVIIDGTDQQTHLPKHSVDIIVVAQALHWFNANAFRKECRRIAKPDAIVISIYNVVIGGKTEHAKESAQHFFNQPTIKEFSNSLSFTREKWMTYMQSHSHSPLPTEPDYPEYLKKIQAVFDNQSQNGHLLYEATTILFWEKVEDLPHDNEI